MIATNTPPDPQRLPTCHGSAQRLLELLHDAGCRIPSAATDLMNAEQAEQILADPAGTLTPDRLGLERLLRLFDPGLSLELQERVGPGRLPLGERKRARGTILAVAPLARSAHVTVTWSDRELIPRAALVGDVVRTVLAWWRGPALASVRLTMRWSGCGGWIVSEASVPPRRPVACLGGSLPGFEAERLALVSCLPGPDASTPVLAAARSLQLVEGDLRVPFTNSAVVEACWCHEETASAGRRTAWTFRALGRTRLLSVAIRVLEDMRPPAAVSIDDSDAVVQPHPDWPEVVLVLGSADWLPGSRVRLLVDAGPEQVELLPNPVVLEPASRSEGVSRRGPGWKRRPVWNVLAAPTHTIGSALAIASIGDRLFTRFRPWVAGCAGHLIACLRRRFLTSLEFDVQPAAMLAYRGGRLTMATGLRLGALLSGTRAPRRTAYAIRRAAGELLSLGPQTREILDVQVTRFGGQHSGRRRACAVRRRRGG